MDHVAELDKITQATRRREFEDGLMDYVLGGFFLFICLMDALIFSTFGVRWLTTSLIKNREITILALVTIFLLLILSIFGARRLIEHIRRQTFWVNRGFVKSLRWQVSWQVNVSAASVLIAMIAAAYWLMLNGSIKQEVVLRTLVSAIGAATGIVFFGMGKVVDLQRYKWTGIVGGILSFLIILLPVPFSISWMVLGIIWMVVLVVSGSWALRRSILALREQDGE
jgi:hypothetical protein